ncbi:hypothetical protein [Janthinobacterium sp. ROICE36]|uniref:hypothetical protein n=1 Tax=Janthinobacterium sp. ROICE36 TaxID=2048670 RepID=UPI0035B5406C
MFDAQAQFIGMGEVAHAGRLLFTRRSVIPMESFAAILLIGGCAHQVLAERVIGRNKVCFERGLLQPFDGQRLLFGTAVAIDEFQRQNGLRQCVILHHALAQPVFTLPAVDGHLAAHRVGQPQRRLRRRITSFGRLAQPGHR